MLKGFSFGEDNLNLDLVLFEEKGSENTPECFKLVAEHVKDLGLGYVIVVSTSGETGIIDELKKKLGLE